MWAGLEGSSEIYQVDASIIAYGVIGVSPCRGFCGECVPKACTNRGKGLDRRVEGMTAWNG